ncbi:type III pantothenate kinase [Candidatus Bipolaricaulota bacterium]|nr:type III pantothenate kinase [Candidatus Bipolaricaulota bacterium]
MFLGLDVGNTNITMGCFRKDELVYTWRVSTDQNSTPDELGDTFRSLLLSSGVEPGELTDAVISSVVPYLNRSLSKGLARFLGVSPTFLRPGDNGLVGLRVDEPEAVGPDRVANVIGGMELYGGPGLVIDFGTATSFELYSEEGDFLGGAISPEMETALEALVERASLLPEIELKLPESVIGKTSAGNINSGFVLGFIGMIEGLIERFKKEYNSDLQIIATGGKGRLFFKQVDQIQHFEKDLVLEGLRLWREKTKEKPS